MNGNRFNDIAQILKKSRKISTSFLKTHYSQLQHFQAWLVSDYAETCKLELRYG